VHEYKRIGYCCWEGDAAVSHARRAAPDS